MDDQQLQDAIKSLEANQQLHYQVNEALRHRLSHMSQGRVADLLEVSPAYVCDWVHGRREFPVQRLRVIYEGFVRKGDANV